MKESHQVAFNFRIALAEGSTVHYYLLNVAGNDDGDGEAVEATVEHVWPLTSTSPLLPLLNLSMPSEEAELYMVPHQSACPSATGGYWTITKAGDEAPAPK